MSLRTQSLIEFLSTLPDDVALALYSHEAICLSVFRQLDALSRHLLMRLVGGWSADAPLTITESTISLQLDARSRYLASGILKTLRQLKLLLPDGDAFDDHDMKKSDDVFQLNPTFSANFQSGWDGSPAGQPLLWAVAKEEVPAKAQCDAAMISDKATERWDALLSYLVAGSQLDMRSSEQTSQQQLVSPTTVDVLLYAGLTRRDNRTQRAAITSLGFQFLLSSRSRQVWFIVHAWLRRFCGDAVDGVAPTLNGHRLSLADCLALILCLTLFPSKWNEAASAARPISCERLSPPQRECLQHLRELGIVFQRTRKVDVFYVTPLADFLRTGLRGTADESSAVGKNGVDRDAGFIIVETNYRIYAYTNSQLYIALLALFTQVVARFPNFVVAYLTRDSFGNALDRGITADQICDFLRTYAHPTTLKSDTMQLSQTYRSGTGVPPVIADQMVIWERERSRMTFTSGVLYSEFESEESMQALLGYAQDIGSVIAAYPKRSSFVVTDDGHPKCKKHWKEIKNN